MIGGSQGLEGMAARGVRHCSLLTNCQQKLRLESELNLLRRFVVCLLPLPLLDGALSGLHQQWISALHLNGLHGSTGEHERFQFHGSAKVHAARNGWVSRDNSIDHLPVACRLFSLRDRTATFEREKKERQQ
jgi:hypothetical protein